MLTRRPVRAAGQVCIGKEAHRLAERDLVAGLDELQGIYPDPRRELWTVAVLPRLQAFAAQPGGIAHLQAASGLTTRALRNVRAGRSTPRLTARRALAALVDDAPATLPERHCVGCGAPVTSPEPGATPDPRQRYCSTACKQHAYRTRRQPNRTTPPVTRHDL